MTYVKIEDDIFRNPKVVSVSSGAKLLYIASICYSGSSLTDGFIPKNAAAILGAEVGITSTTKAVKELVEAGLWDVTERGYQVHDYLEFNESAEKVEAKRAAARERMRRKSSSNFDETSREVSEKPKRSSPEVSEPTTTTDVSFSSEKENTSADAPAPAKPKRAKPLPEHGPAQQIVKAFCESVGIDKPVSYSKAVGQAQLLADAGITPEDIPDAVAWCRGQKWLATGFDLGSILSNADKWRAARRAEKSNVRRFVV